MLAQKKTVITPEEYLAMERESDIKSEYLNGEIFAMAGASQEHNQISSNIVRILGNKLLEKPCSVYASDMKVKIETIKVNKYTYPDIVITCNDEKFEDEKRDILLNPLVIIEILSDSTEAYDRGMKFIHYQQIDSLVEYIIVSQKFCQVERFIRTNDNEWIYSEFHEMNNIIQINVANCEFPVKEIYRKIDFNE